MTGNITKKDKVKKQNGFRLTIKKGMVFNDAFARTILEGDAALEAANGDPKSDLRRSIVTKSADKGTPIDQVRFQDSFAFTRCQKLIA